MDEHYVSNKKGYPSRSIFLRGSPLYLMMWGNFLLHFYYLTNFRQGLFNAPYNFLQVNPTILSTPQGDIKYGAENANWFHLKEKSSLFFQE